MLRTILAATQTLDSECRMNFHSIDFAVRMSSEKDTLITWNEAVELFKSKPDDTACIRQAADKLETLIDGQPQQGVSKLCYNVSILRMLLGDKIKALKVSSI